jgi:murein DD-endopeptidase MepM/ murein hydrolase activator NlpD
MIDPDFGPPVKIYTKVGSGWGPRTDHVHLGIDIAMPNGTPVISVGDGIVTRSQKVNNGDAGIHVAVQHPSGITSRYLHFEKAIVNVGEQVKKGQVIGYSNNTGRSSGPHLHFELRAPELLLPEIEAAVGKPKKTGWGAPMDRYGYGIPSEPWIPIDEYRWSTVLKDRSYGIPFYKDIHSKGITKFAPVGTPIALGLGLGLGAALLLARNRV